MSIAVGCATRDRTVPFCSTFAAFFTRAFDQIRMAAISESNINLCGSHCGVSIGEWSWAAYTCDILRLPEQGVGPGVHYMHGVLH